MLLEIGYDVIRNEVAAMAGKAGNERQPGSYQEDSDRAKVWCTLIAMAQNEFRQAAGGEPKPIEELGLLPGVLDKEQVHLLVGFALLCLAAESRVNHLLWWLKDQGKLSSGELEAVLGIRLERRWELLPVVAQIGESLIGRLRSRRREAGLLGVAARPAGGWTPPMRARPMRWCCPTTAGECRLRWRCSGQGRSASGNG